MTDLDHCGFSCTYEKKKFDIIMKDLWMFSDYDKKTALEIATEFAIKSEKVRQAIEDLK